MTSDIQAGITGTSGITWNVYGKILSVAKSTGTISYSYDATGNRISKTSGTTVTTYVRDAQGNVLAVYQRTGSNALQKIESHIYGSSRIGIVGQETTAPTTLTLISPYQPARFITFTRGEKAYELTNHLGNVLVTISDKKLAVVSSGAITSYNPDVVTASDYYPFGMQMPGRTFNASGYRYGFNGQEKETELNENITTAQFWEYDSRLGRRWNMDPKPNPSVSFYATFENNPLCKKDPLGDSSVFDNRGNKLYYNKKDKDLRVFLRDEKGKQTLIGTLGKSINVEVIANNILKDNKINAQHMAYAGWIARVLPHSLWDYKNKTSTIFGVAWGYDEGDADGVKKSGHTSFITSKYTFNDAAAFGNYNAGYTGTQAAIKRVDQYWWAGMGEVTKFNNSWERIKQIWTGTKPYGDQPFDYMRNTEGMDDADAEIKREGGKPKVSISENMAKYSPYIY